jgi:hypothetical protein
MEQLHVEEVSMQRVMTRRGSGGRGDSYLELREERSRVGWRAGQLGLRQASWGL